METAYFSDRPWSFGGKQRIKDHNKDLMENEIDDFLSKNDFYTRFKPHRKAGTCRGVPATKSSACCVRRRDAGSFFAALPRKASTGYSARPQKSWFMLRRPAPEKCLLSRSTQGSWHMSRRPLPPLKTRWYMSPQGIPQ